MHRRHRLIIPSIAIAALSALTAGCGGGGSPNVANVATTTTAAATTTSATPLAFSQCMRSNGVPSFPDPQGDSIKLTIHDFGASRTPQFRRAMSACDHLLPNRGGEPESSQQIATRLADGLSFARCMRSHGVTRFPDPTSQGQLTVEMVQAQGIDVHSPAVLHVVQECLPASHGALTPAKIREALANAGG
jgi:hypothetical protein